MKLISKVLALSFVLLFSSGCASKLETKHSPDIKDRVYCTEEQREVWGCFGLHQPVCGYPEGKTYDNPCLACMDKDVEYWRPCPK